MRYLLDTDIVSNITKPAPSESLIAWMAEQPDQDIFIASLTLAEVRRGILELPAGKRRALDGRGRRVGRRASRPVTGRETVASQIDAELLDDARAQRRPEGVTRERHAQPGIGPLARQAVEP